MRGYFQVFAGLLLATAVLAGQSATAAENRPNILFCIADDWGYPHASSYGDPVCQTPTFDRVAREGILFTNAYVSSPSCTPSRAAILTGQFHWRLEESANLWSTLQTKYPVYPDLLAAAGYHVGYSRKGWGPGKVEVGGRKENPAGKKYKDFKQFLAACPQGQPFCFWFGSTDPHRGYALHSGQKSGMDLAKIKLPACYPDSPEIRGDVADYYFEVQRFDREVGERIAMIKELGELENTIVVIAGDHGMPFPRGKGNLYDLGARVPLAVRWGKQVQAERTVTDFVSLTDLAPTFLEAAGVEVPEPMTGKSLMTVFKSPKSGRLESTRDHVLTGKERHVPAQEAPNSDGTPMRGLRTDDYLYIRNFSPDRWPAGTPDYSKAYIRGAWLADCDNGPTKTYLVEHQSDAAVQPFYNLCFAKRPAEELYDLKKDPDQLKNVAADPAYAEIKAQLSQRLMTALDATGDPRASGGGDFFDKYPYYGGAPKYPGFDN